MKTLPPRGLAWALNEAGLDPEAIHSMLAQRGCLTDEGRREKEAVVSDIQRRIRAWDREENVQARSLLGRIADRVRSRQGGMGGDLEHPLNRLAPRIAASPYVDEERVEATAWDPR